MIQLEYPVACFFNLYDLSKQMLSILQATFFVGIINYHGKQSADSVDGEPCEPLAFLSHSDHVRGWMLGSSNFM